MTPLTAVLWQSKRWAKVYRVTETRAGAGNALEFVSMDYRGDVRERQDGMWIAFETDDCGWGDPMLAPLAIRHTAQEAIKALEAGK